MDADAALARLYRMTAAEVEPVLGSAELEDLLSLAAITDTSGIYPDDDDWTPTYNAIWLNAAAAEGWRTKAAKLGGGENFSSDGASFDPQVRRQFCLDMADTYAKKVAGSPSVAGRTATIGGVAALFGDLVL